MVGLLVARPCSTDENIVVEEVLCQSLNLLGESCAEHERLSVLAHILLHDDVSYLRSEHTQNHEADRAKQTRRFAGQPD